MSYDTNVYYNPEKAGLSIAASIDWYEADYEFCMTVVWRDVEGNFYVADDAGCSCYSPFDAYNSVGDLTGPLISTEVIAHLQGEAVPYGMNKAEAELRAFEAISSIHKFDIA